MADHLPHHMVAVALLAQDTTMNKVMVGAQTMETQGLEATVWAALQVSCLPEHHMPLLDLVIGRLERDQTTANWVGTLWRSSV